MRTLILISSYADSETGECNPSNATLATMLGKQERAVRISITEIVNKGFLSIHQGGGKGRRFRIESADWFIKPGRKHAGLNPVGNLPGCDDEPGRKPTTLEEPTRQVFVPQPGRFLSLNPVGNLPGPNKNTVFNTLLNTESKQASATEESKPDSLGDACVQALADLVKPTPEIPADLKRSIEQLGLHSWLDMLVNHGVSPTDWRVRETIQQLHGKADLKSPFGLARKIFNDLPEIQPAKSPATFGRRPGEPAHVPNMRPPEKPKSANEAVHTEFCNRIGMSPLGGEECAAALAAIHAVPKTKPPGEYRGELEAIARKFEVTE